MTTGDGIAQAGAYLAIAIALVGWALASVWHNKGGKE